jgi:hypothetical protein
MRLSRGHQGAKGAREKTEATSWTIPSCSPRPRGRESNCLAGKSGGVILRFGTLPFVLLLLLLPPPRPYRCAVQSSLETTLGANFTWRLAWPRKAPQSHCPPLAAARKMDESDFPRVWKMKSPRVWIAAIHDSVDLGCEKSPGHRAQHYSRAITRA